MKLNTTYIDNINTRLEHLNSYLDEVSDKYSNANQEQLNTVSVQLSDYLESELILIRQNIVNWLKPTLKPLTEKMELLESIVHFSFSDIGSVITFLGKVIAYQFAGPYAEMVEMYADISEKVITLSNNIQSLKNHSFSNPNMPSISVEIPPITMEDIV